MSLDWVDLGGHRDIAASAGHAETACSRPPGAGPCAHSKCSSPSSGSWEPTSRPRVPTPGVPPQVPRPGCRPHNLGCSPTPDSLRRCPSRTSARPWGSCVGAGPPIPCPSRSHTAGYSVPPLGNSQLSPNFLVLLPGSSHSRRSPPKPRPMDDPLPRSRPLPWGFYPCPHDQRLFRLLPVPPPALTGRE